MAAAISETSDAKTSGFTASTVGFAKVVMEPKRADATKAHPYPIMVLSFERYFVLSILSQVNL